MKYFSIVFLVITFSCGSPTTPKKDYSKDSLKSKIDSTNVSKPTKDYLTKRPEEHRDFLYLVETKAFKGKIAKDKDVKNKLAAFSLKSDGKDHKAIDARLPFFAYLNLNNQPTFVCVFQAEYLKGDTLLGYKTGRDVIGICRPNELEYLTELTKKFIFKKTENPSEK